MERDAEQTIARVASLCALPVSLSVCASMCVCVGMCGSFVCAGFVVTQIHVFSVLWVAGLQICCKMLTEYRMHLNNSAC